jgi:outer membrane protein OmpA-like peptidoglycan-associated protein
MRNRFTALTVLTALALPLAAQETFLPVEIGAFGQYTKFAAVTKLDNAFGLGATVSIPIYQPFAFQYEGDFGSTKSTRVGKLTALNNRFDIVYHHPIGDRRTLFFGGGWTGSRYKTDTTYNQYDSGLNALVGVRICVSDNWAFRGSAVMDFKDPSDQVPTGDRTQTLSLRAGLSRFFGGKTAKSPCVVIAPVVAPPPPPPAAAPPPPAPKAEPKPAPAPPPPPPPPAPAPKSREVFRLSGVYFDFDKSTLKKSGKDTLETAVKYLTANPGVRVEIQGHTDSIGTDGYNRSLSDRRATTVMKYLRTRGIDPSRMSTKGLGESQPAADNGTKEGRALNRRVVIIEL